MSKLTLLKQYFGHGSFRPGQESLVDALLSGRDVMGVMPTGAGKSVCYQLPALMLPGLTLVISPLISLMKDQVAGLIQAGIPAAYINSTLDLESYRDVFRQVRRGECRLLYVAPERLQTEGFLHLTEELPVSMVAVDEAHCVSQWGQDFRPSYLQIAELIRNLPQRPVVGAFTATATQQVREDIENLLELQNPLRVTTGFDRPNLSFEVARPAKKSPWLFDFLSGNPNQSGIVYCSTRKTVDAVWMELQEQGIPAARYHAGMADQERKESQEDFVYDRVRVMVATNAFGMGIDKSNVSFVVHYNMPKDLESYYQEAGRAGRDGEPARCVLLFAPSDIRTAQFLISNSQEDLDPERERLSLSRLNRMVRYCKTTDCLRGEILDYFGEPHPERCGNCSCCREEFTQRDITVEAQKILSAVARVERKYRYSFGITLVIQHLRGSQNQRISQLGLDTLPTYGIMRDTDQRQVQDYIDLLLKKDCLRFEGDPYPVLRLGPQAKGVLFQGQRVSIRERASSPAQKPAGKKSAVSAVSRKPDPLAPPVDQDLLGVLKALRLRLAKEEDVPAYVVFSNASLSDMAARQPRTMLEFLEVSGVGQVKAQRYGQLFLDAVRTWLDENQGGLGDFGDSDEL